MKHLIFIGLICTCGSLFAQERISVASDSLRLEWSSDGQDWHLQKIELANGAVIAGNAIPGVQSVLYTAEQPDMQPSETFRTNRNIPFPEKVFRYPARAWESNVSQVALNTAGECFSVDSYKLVSRSPLTFEAATDAGTLRISWRVEGNQILVRQDFTASKDGYYSVSTPAIFTTGADKIRRAVIPGYLNSDEVSDDFVSAYGYGHYIPDRPVIYQDRCATTPVSILSGEQVTVAVAPEAEYPRKPHDATQSTHFDWNVGYAMMNRRNDLTPSLWYPVLGQPKSFLKADENIRFEYRYIVSSQDWYTVYREAVYDVFDFEKTREVTNRQSLIDRVLKMYRYLADVKTSRFRQAECEDLMIGAQDYMGGVAGSDKDAMKNSDYGAMWMLGTLTSDSLLLRDVLPYARNFKMKQIYTDPESPYCGAVKGQYYLWKSRSWAEEWGQHIEPIGVTYYALIDLGNILLFSPKDKEARQNMRLAADYLLSVQKADGSWEIGIDKKDGSTIYPDLQDLRPTFYGLIVAYDILKDKKYLDAAVKGADWFIEKAVNTGRFIGVCGDTRFSPDFATAQSVQALLEMYRITGREIYRDSALQTAKYYTTYIYTYPSGLTEMQTHRKQHLPAWGFTQAGLCFEHAGTIGSSNTRGPILLASFAGLFTRLYGMTGDTLFIDMARAAANGRDGFVDPKTSVASYYWDSFNSGPGAYPHHAWWQIGWIMDYLVSEAEVRSEGAVSFPRGFITPKVGPHRTLGFAPGKINGKKARLILSDHLITNENPSCEWLTAVSGKTLYVIVMNSSNEPVTTRMKVDGTEVNGKRRWTKDLSGVELPPFGLKIFEIR